MRSPNYNFISYFLILSVLAFIIVLGLMAGCTPPSPKPTEIAQISKSLFVAPEQDEMLFEDYPEWAKKDWVILYMLNSYRYYYVDKNSKDAFNNSSEFVTIEGYSIVVNESFTLSETKFPSDKRWADFCFPCVKNGKWHPEINCLNIESNPEDLFKCEKCDRWYSIGYMVFQEETGHVQWSRYKPSSFNIIKM